MPHASPPFPPLSPPSLCRCLDSLDYNKYYDAMPTRTLTAAQNGAFVQFSSGALKAAQGKLAEFLALLPREAIETARQQMEAGY